MMEFSWHVPEHAEVGRINPLEQEVKNEDVLCPLMHFQGRAVERPTFRKEECERRFLLNQDCRKYCDAHPELRERYQLPPAMSHVIQSVGFGYKVAKPYPCPLCGQEWDIVQANNHLPKAEAKICTGCHRLARLEMLIKRHPEPLNNSSRSMINSERRKIRAEAEKGHKRCQEWVNDNR